MPSSAAPRFERLTLAVLWLFTTVALGGYATVGLHPSLLAGVPNAASAYAAAFTFFPRAHILLAFAVCVVVLGRRAGTRWLPALAAVYLLSLGAELVGTTVGAPFGPYRYTDGLGVKWLGHVPMLIPLSWFFMATPSFLLARRAIPATVGPRRREVLGALTGALVLLAWDLALDPAMSHVTKYWVWLGDGSYYGMPASNLLGWYVTGLALMAALRLTHAHSWGAELNTRWIAGFYFANLALPVGMVALSGLWGAVVVSAIGVALSFSLPRLSWPRPRAARGTLAREVP